MQVKSKELKGVSRYDIQAWYYSLQVTPMAEYSQVDIKQNKNEKKNKANLEFFYNHWLNIYTLTGCAVNPIVGIDYTRIQSSSYVDFEIPLLSWSSASTIQSGLFAS